MSKLGRMNCRCPINLPDSDVLYVVATSPDDTEIGRSAHMKGSICSYLLTNNFIFG